MIPHAIAVLPDVDDVTVEDEAVDERGRHDLVASAPRRWRRLKRRRQASAGRTPDGLPVHSFGTFIDDLAGVLVIIIRLPGAGRERATVVTRRTRLQNRAFQFLEVNPDRIVPMNVTV